MATVFTLAGAFGLGVLVPPQLGGSVTAGNTVVDIAYDNFGIFNANIDDGASKLNDAITSTSGPKIGFGHSLGAACITRWLHDYGPTSTVDPAELMFVCVGNPLRRYGGFVPACYTLADDISATIVAALTGLGDWFLIENTLAPVDTPYMVVDVARQYDGFADWPAIPDLVAVTNAIFGMQWIHPFYEFVSLDDPLNAHYVEGNIAYVWNPTPLLFEYTRPEIEAAYARPVIVEAPPPVLGFPSPPPTPLPPLPQLDPLNNQLLHGDWAHRAAAADTLAGMKTKADPEWIVTVYDKLWRPIGELGDDMIELSGTDPRNNLPSATLKVKGDSPLIDTFMSCRTTMVGITVETGGLRFPYYVKTHKYRYEKGAWTSVVELLGIWDILNYLIIWPSWVLPIQGQPFSHAVFVWALCTTIENMVTECAIRIQSGLNEFINNALSLNPDIRAWFGSLLQSNGNVFTMLKTPIYVVRTNPFEDTSPLMVRTVRMESCGTVIKDITGPYGVDVRVDLWLPGDEQPDIWTKTVPFMALDQPTYVVTVKDRSQIEGPTKTVLDSVIRTVVDVEGSLLGNTLDPILNPRGAYAPEGVFIAPVLGVDFVAPWAVLVAPDHGEKGSVVSCEIADHTPEGWQHIVGGRSPKWLNDLMNATFAWLIDSISILIGFSGIPSNLLDGFLNNAFLAFQLIEHYERRNDVGPYHPAIEQMHPTASAPYNVETVFAFVNALWDSRGYTAATATFRNGEVFTLGKDVFRGGLMSLLYHGRKKLYTDYIENVMYRITATERDVTVQIGDGKKNEPPLAKHQRNLSGLLEAINVLTLAPQS